LLFDSGYNKKMNKNKDVRPTLKTISAASGMAVATVSRALKDAPDLNEETKKKIRAIAKELGYVPNRAGVRLRTGKTNVIALAISTSQDIIDLTGRLIVSVNSTLANTPYHLVVSPDDPNQSRMESIRYIVETRSADAIIIDRTEPEDPRVKYLMEKGFPFVTFGRTNWSDEHPFFDFDNESFGKLAATQLCRLGRRHILMIAPPIEQSYTQHMIEGAKAALENTGVSFSILPTLSDGVSGEEIRSAMVSYLTENPQTDGIICSSTTSTISAIAGLEQVGKELGKDIDLFTKESVSFLGFFRPQVCSVAENVNYAGEFLANAAIRAVESPELPPMQALAVAKIRPRNLKIAEWHFE
jgi:LacI family transcriptional regulator